MQACVHMLYLEWYASVRSLLYYLYVVESWLNLNACNTYNCSMYMMLVGLCSHLNIPVAQAYQHKKVRPFNSLS